MNINLNNISSIDYYPNYINNGYSQILEKELNNLFSKYKWKNNYIQNKKDESHQALWFGPLNYKYGKFKNLEKQIMPEEISNLARIIEFKQGFENGFLNSVYINKYNHSGIGYHHDNDNIFKTNNDWNEGKEIIVVVISIGATSKISISDINKNFINSIEVENNSLYIMNKNFQNNLLHKVGDSKGERYSLTFRHCIF